MLASEKVCMEASSCPCFVTLLLSWAPAGHHVQCLSALVRNGWQEAVRDLNQIRRGGLPLILTHSLLAEYPQKVGPFSSIFRDESARQLGLGEEVWEAAGAPGQDAQILFPLITSALPISASHVLSGPFPLVTLCTALSIQAVP